MTTGGTLGVGGSNTPSATSSASTNINTGGSANGGSVSSGGSLTGGVGAQGASTSTSNAGGNASGGSSTGKSNTGGTRAVGSSTGGNSGGVSSSGGTRATSSNIGGSKAGASSAGGTGALGGTSAGGATSSGNFTVQVQLASAIKSNSPGTIGIVTWSMAGVTVTSATIEFGLDTTYGMTAPVDLTQANYQTALLGMKPSKTYHFRVVAKNGSTTYTSDDYTVQTGPAATSVSISGFKVNNESARERGFIVTSYWQGTGSAVPFIMDADGEIVWWYSGGPSGIARARMSADAKNMWMVVASLTGGPVQRVSMDTLDPQTYSSTKASHDIAAVSSTTMAYLDYGESDCNSIFEIDPSGTTKEVFESQTVVTGNGCHGNAVRYSQAEDLYSFSDVSTDIFVVNRSGAVQWRLSERVAAGNSDWGGTQHGHQLLANSILIFANRGGGSNASTAIEYTLQGQLVKEFTSGGFSANLGDVQRLPGGNTLITYSNGHLMQEVDSQGNVLLEVTGGNSSFGYAEWRESLYGAPQDISD